MKSMRRLTAGILVSLAWSAPLLAQERDRSLERISFALQQQSPDLRALVVDERPPAARLGILTVVQPTLPGEMIRVSIPIGELVTRAFKGVAAANQRRREAAARRRVDAALQRFTEQR
jgi:hypothetical protein